MLSNFPALPGMTAPVNRPAAKLRARGRQGFALVVVLAVILMLSVLIVGLLIMAENETKTAARYMDAADARLAADSVVQIVEGQIKQATLSGIDADGKGTQAWASQPGAIRVFNNSGGLVNIFKLYSSDSMVVNTPDSLFTDVPANWQDTPDAFVDLNAPISRNGQWIYPVASPDALPGGPNPVAGFDTTRAQSTVAWDDRLAMPARWIYIQKDGSMSTDPTVGDPVVRVAYWTDDESSKININTASATDATSYADIPRANFTPERESQGWRQPAQNEFNRYPGHPATVSLTTVFSGLANSIQQIIEASPRYRWGGSANGTVKVSTGVSSSGRIDLVNPGKRERLFVSPDEYLYSVLRQPQLSQDAPTLDARRFFLTTTSRSSELNLFGQPRITIWPLSSENNDLHRTPFDELIAHCSTIGSGAEAKPYYFQRLNPLSQTADWDSQPRNQSLFAYLQKMTANSIPGFGGNFLNKYDVAGGGVSGERDQILAEIFDYIRCTNLNDTYQGQPAGYLSFTKKVEASVGGISASLQPHIDYAGGGFVLPIRINAARGAGRVPVISEVGLWLIQTNGTQGVSPQDHLPPSTAEVQPGLIVETFSPMQGFMLWLPQNFSIRVRNIVAPKIQDKDGHYRNLFPDDQTESASAGPGAFFGNSQSVGGIDGFAWNMATHGNVAASIANNIQENPFLTKKTNAVPVGAGPVHISGGEIEISLQCDPNPAGLNSKGGTAYQTYRLTIPTCDLPVPGAVDWRDGGTASVDASNKNGWYSRVPVNSDPVFNISDVVHGIEARDGDFRTIACLQAVPSGFYLPHTGFESLTNFAHGFRGSLDKGYQGTTNGGYLSVPYGGEAPGNYWRDQRPKITARISALRDEGWEGDFDNGIGSFVDGPYLNKSDEGALAHNANTPPYFYSIWHIGDGLFSPLKQVPSPVVFGSLPTGVKRTELAYAGGTPSNAKPWRTLNFCPNPLALSAHYGLQNPPDHLLLDLFTMPVVEPYAISEPFSTAGRLNMNYQMVPFTHIKRQTAMHAALAAQQITAIANSVAASYKTSTSYTQTSGSQSIRYPINVAETLSQFDERFDSRDIFRSASEICSVFLVPSGTTGAGLPAFWTAHQLTGNNSRERPYATLYPLLTTKSNVFTTHIRAQAIKRLPSGKTNVNSEYRGSVTFERYLDPNDPVFANGTADPDKVSLEPYFRFRTLEAKQFDL